MSLNFEELMAENTRLSTENNGGGGFGGGLDQFVKMPEGNGTVLLRILPPVTGADGKPKLYQATRTHRLNGKSVHCRRELKNGKWVGDCPVCDYINWLWRKIEDAQRQGNTPLVERLKAEARDLKAVERYYYPVIVRKEQQSNGDVKENVGPKIYSCGKSVQARIIRAICGDVEADEAGLGDITDVKTGRDFKVVKRMKGGVDNYPEYNDSKFLDASPLGDPDKVSKWLDTRPDVSTFRKVLSVEELEFEVDVHRGVKVDTRNKSRFDDGPSAPVGGGAAAAVAAASNDDEDDAPAPTPAPVRTPTPTAAAAPSAPAPAAEESVALDQDDFIKRLKEI